MIKYIIKRLLFSIPTVLFISVLTFFISSLVPGDPAEMLLNQPGKTREKNYRTQYVQVKKRLGLHLPMFYFNIKTPYSLSNADSLNEKQILFCEAINNEFKQSQAGQLLLKEIIRIENNDTISRNNLIEFYQGNWEECLVLLQKTNKVSTSALSNISDSLMRLKTNAPFNIPVIMWNGFNNQFHVWLKKVIQLNFGKSYIDDRNVLDIVMPALYNTLLLCFLGLLFSYLFAIPVGTYLAIYKNRKWAVFIQNSLFALYSVPVFWMATILIFFFAGGDYFNIFPAYGLGDLPPQAPFIDRFLESVYHLMLPVFCFSYTGTVVITRQMKGGIEQNLTQEYVRTAFAKGLTFNRVLWRHIFKNSVIPVIALFTTTLPYLLSGSVILEYIFSINGIGKLIFDSLLSRNYPVIFSIVFITSIITLLGNIIADILLLKIDPRISINKKNR